MSFDLSFIRPDRAVAVVAVDDRARWRLLEGDQDPEAVPVVGLTDGVMKLHMTPGGYCVGSPSPDYTACLAEALADQPADRSALQAAVRRWAGPAMDELAAVSPLIAARIRAKQTTFMIGSDACGLYRLALDWSGAELFPGTPDAQVMVGCPAGVPAAALGPALTRYQDLVLDGTLADVVRGTAALYAEARHLGGPAGAVGPSLTIGFVAYADGAPIRGQFGPVLHSVAFRAPDTAFALPPKSSRQGRVMHYAENEIGDVICVPTDRFVAMNPISGGSIVGRYWANAVIVETSPDGRTFGVWIRQWSDLAPALQTVAIPGPTQLSIGYGNFTPFPTAPWTVVAGYARPAAATGAPSNAIRNLSQVELPQGTRIVRLTATYYVGNASAGAAAVSIALNRLHIAGGVVIIDQLANVFDDVEINDWQTASDDLATVETIDWTTYTYQLVADVSATGTVDNARVSGAVIECE